MKSRFAIPAFLLALSCLPVQAQDIQVTSVEDRTAARGPETAYTGVGIAEFMFLPDDNSDLAGARITFEPGSRTSWHSHLAGQYLIITSGMGWVQARGEAKRLVKAGDVVWTPPGVFHWHGATSEQTMTHIAVWQFVDGSGGEFGPLVTDAEYLGE